MNKKALVSIVSTKTGISRADVEDVINKTFETIREAVCRRERVILRGFGTYDIKSYGAQKFKQPRTGDYYELPPRDLPSFTPVKAFKDAVQQKA